LSTIAANANIPINSGSSVTGTGISLSGSDAVLLAEPGVYLVSYYVQGDAQAGNETIRAALTLNGAQVPGTLIASVTESTIGEDPTEPAVSNTVIVQVPTGGSLLRLVNGPLAIGHVQTDLGGATTASLNVIQIS
jgi:hypothetical protein